MIGKSYDAHAQINTGGGMQSLWIRKGSTDPWTGMRNGAIYKHDGLGPPNEWVFQYYHQISKGPKYDEGLADLSHAEAHRPCLLTAKAIERLTSDHHAGIPGSSNTLGFTTISF